MKAYLALIKIDLLLALRAKSVIFFNYLFPLIFFFVFAQSFHAAQGGVIVQVVTMVAVIGTLGNGLFGAGMRAVSERESNILRRYKVTPIGPTPLLVASMVTGLLTYLPYIVLMMTLAHFLYHMAFPSNFVQILLFISCGVVAFRALGLIVAAVVNSMQESAILTQVLYISMLFLSGASLPTSMFPSWLLTVTQFIPATYLMSGMQGLLLRHESLWQNAAAIGALLLTAVVGAFIATKLFRWEKEEKLRPAAKLWVVAVLMPFILLGSYQAYSKENIKKTQVLDRDLRRSRNTLIRDARIIVGDGKVIESGSILIQNGKIAQVFEGAAPEASELRAEAIDAAGKTVMPGLIDVHVHLGSPGGFYEDPKSFVNQDAAGRALAQYLFSGVTAVKSAGDSTSSMLALRSRYNSGERLGAELFAVGPLFTTPKGHGVELARYMPEQYRAQFLAEFTRTPKDAAEAREMVRQLKAQKVDGIKAILDGGVAGALFDRMDLNLLKAIGAESRAQNLPLVVHVGDTRDVSDALDAGAVGIEHGSYRDRTPVEVFQRMASAGVTFDPTLSVVEGMTQFRNGESGVLNRSLLQQVAPPGLISETRKMMNRPEMEALRSKMQSYPLDMKIAKENLLAAWKVGVMLVTGSDAGNPLVIHGPTVQREMELWVEAGIPATVAIQAATANAAKLLRAEQRIGTIRKGMDATLLIVEGNPLQDIHVTEQVSAVIYKGERISRSELFTQD
jgi:imidazolonepropionase-like amidohydrolase/ABC-type multidrug transport system permease subunit